MSFVRGRQFHIERSIFKKNNIGKRRNIYNSIVESTYVDYPQDASDFVQESPYGGIDSLLMHSIRSMPFPLGVHLLQG